MRRALIYAHYDSDGLVDDHVMYALTCYRQYFHVIHFVSTADLTISEQNRVASLVERVIVRENIGYDFMSWRVGFEMLPTSVAFDEVVFANDSCYGPCTELARFWPKIYALEADLWGASLNRQFRPHAQSYFMGFSRKAISSGFINRFWQSIEVIPDKSELILAYEVGLSARAEAEGLRVAGAIDFATKEDEVLERVIADNMSRTDPGRAAKAIEHLRMEPWPNPMQLYWGESLRRGLPFVKVELLRDNPLNANLDTVHRHLKDMKWYDLSLISRHLGRTADCTAFPPAPDRTNAPLRAAAQKPTVPLRQELTRSA